jgi:hypothetical protein
VLIFISVIQFLTVSVMDDDIELERHLLLFNAAFDFSLLLLAIAAIYYIGRGLPVARLRLAKALPSSPSGLS